MWVWIVWWCLLLSHILINLPCHFYHDDSILEKLIFRKGLLMNIGMFSKGLIGFSLWTRGLGLIAGRFGTKLDIGFSPKLRLRRISILELFMIGISSRFIASLLIYVSYVHLEGFYLFYGSTRRYVLFNCIDERSLVFI